MQLFGEYIKTHTRLKWSPVQTSISLALLYPKDKHMQISHESIYIYIYLLGRGALKKELTEGLRQRKKTVIAARQSMINVGGSQI
jgi:IS30 family transposase